MTTIGIVSYAKVGESECAEYSEGNFTDISLVEWSVSSQYSYKKSVKLRGVYAAMEKDIKVLGRRVVGSSYISEILHL